MQRTEYADPQHHRPANARAGFTIRGAVEWSGISRTTLYRFANEGKLTIRKVGRTSIVDGASLAALVASLPVATFNGQREAA
jgi:hypothetical protein